MVQWGIIGDMNWVGLASKGYIFLSRRNGMKSSTIHITNLTNLEPSLGSRAMQCGTRLVIKQGQRLPVLRVLSKVAQKHLGSLRGSYFFQPYEVPHGINPARVSE